MKKLLAIILSALLLTAFVACSDEETENGNGYDDYKDTTVEETQWTDTKNKNTFYFEAVDSESIMITDFSTSESTPHAVVIPATMHGKRVVGIGDEAFANAAEIKTLGLPAAKDYGAELPEFTIGKGAFRGCFTMQSITIPSYVVSVGEKAFYGCESAKMLTIEEGGKLSAIADSTFQACTALTSVSVPGNVKTVGKAAFFECTALTSVTLGNGVVELGAQAFQNCTALETLNVPATLETVGKHAFAGCDAIKKASIPTWIISEIEKANLVEVKLVAGDAIPSSAFKSCDALKTVTLNAEIASIGEYAFVGCRSLTALQIPAVLAEIGNSTFKNCSSLTSITIPNGVSKIGNGAFSGCDSLTEVTIPAAVIEIGDEAFASCDKLAKFTVEKDNREFAALDGNLFTVDKTVLVQYAIGAEASEYVIPETVVEIKPSAFESCLTIQKLTVPASVETIGKSAFVGCVHLADVTAPALAVTSLDKTGLQTLAVTSGTELPEAALANAKVLKTVTLADTVTTIGDGAFSGCVSLEGISIPAGVKKLGENLFNGCAAMKSVSIPASVTAIGEKAFYGCRALELVSIPKAVTEIGDEAFRGCATIGAIVLPEGIVTIGDYAFNECTSLMGFYLSDENEAYSVLNRDLYNKEGTVLIQYALGKMDPLFYDLPETVTEIAENAVKGALNLNGIHLPESVKTVGANAFADCVNVTVARIPTLAIGKLATDNLVTLHITAGKEIGEAAFANCKTLETLWLAETVETVDPTAFEGCEKLVSVMTPVTVIGSLPKAQIENLWLLGTSVPSKAFSECASLKSVTLADSIKTIGSEAFNKCAALESVKFGSALETIGENAFSDCKALTSINLPASVATIEANAFARTHALVDIIVAEENAAYKEVDNVLYTKDGKTLVLYPASTHEYSFTVPTGVTEIARNAFNGARFLVQITISKDVVTIGDAAFSGCSKLVEINNLSSLDIKAGKGNGNIATNELVYVHKNGTSKVSIKDDFILFTTKDGEKDVVALMGFIGGDETVTLPAEITQIGAYAFKDTPVTTFHFDGKKADWEAFSKAETWADGIDAYTVKCTDGDVVFEKPADEELLA